MKVKEEIEKAGLKFNIKKKQKKNTEDHGIQSHGCHFLLQETFQTQIKPTTPALADNSLPLNPLGNPHIQSITSLQ